MTNDARRRISIRTRITLLMFGYIAAVFFVVLVVFNLLVHEYIKSIVNEQLKDFLQAAEYGRALQGETPPPGEQLQPDQFIIMPSGIRKLPRGPVGKTEAIIISENYELIFPAVDNVMFFDIEEIVNLVSELEASQVNLTNKQITQIKVSGREFYLVAIPVQGAFFSGTGYMIPYIDMTTITAFAGRINTVLFVVTGLAFVFASIVAAFLSGVIAKPIRELTRFARRIGKGDFTQSTVNYQELELAELADSMNTAARQLDNFDREQKTFFQNVSHELRTPLQSIRCSAEGIEHGILQQQLASKVIISETDRLSEMVEDLLYLSRIDNLSRDDDLRTACDLRELLSNCAARQGSVAAEKGVCFVFNFAADPLICICSEKHLTRAFTNIISNAIRYAREAITISCRQEKGQTIIEIIDDGKGVSDQDLPFIFERFYKGRGGKHGIGLAIVKTIIEQHRGQISVKSDSSGTAFTITL
ncbi:MAG: HAMP domain-containing histidine kinase [Firmicutes bacterium]|nr:HAMP domain-containing histidine kinase [Bacillota bacterium]